MKKCKLGQLIEVSRGMSLPGENYSTTGKLIRLTLGNFDEYNGGFKLNSSKEDIYYVGEVDEKFILNKGDIITPLTEQTRGLLGTTAKIPISDTYIASGDIGIIKCIDDNFDINFCYYLISSPYVKKQLSANAQQTRIRHTSPDKIKDVTVFIPEYNIQKKIGNLLNNIDIKIQKNKLVILEIESLIKLIFDYWFLQFDFPNDENKPYKSSGGEMVYNENLKREIPKDWTVGSLNDIAEYINGLACQRHRPIFNDKKLPVIKITEMHHGFTNKTEFVRSDIDKKYIIEDGDILFSWSATLETMIWTGGKGGLNQHIFKVVPKDFGKYYVYQQLSSYIINFVRMAESRKTTMGHITKDHLLQSKIPLPPKELTYKFNDLVSDFCDKFVLNNQENRELNNLKNFLIPLLLSGQVSFKD